MKKIILYVALFLGLQTQAQEKKIALSVGDAIPELKYSKWIKGNPISNFNDGKTYIFEFWATWCGPCIAEMPHLSKIAKQYQGKAEVIGVNVWEKVGDKPYESSLDKVIKFVEGSGDRMAYNVVADNNAQDVANNWLKPAGVNGIPTTFIVKNNTIQWIGHPYRMDSVLATIVDGSHDMLAFKKEYEEKQLKSQNSQAEVARLFEEANAAAKAKDLDKAFNILDGLEASQPVYKFSISFGKFNMLLEHKSEADAMAFYDANLASNPSSGYVVADLMVKSDKAFSEKSYNMIYDALNKMEQKMSQLEILKADLLIKKGDKALAIKHVETAITLGEAEAKNPQFEGRIFPHTVDEYKEKLKELKK